MKDVSEKLNSRGPDSSSHCETLRNEQAVMVTTVVRWNSVGYSYFLIIEPALQVI